MEEGPNPPPQPSQVTVETEKRFKKITHSLTAGIACLVFNIAMSVSTLISPGGGDSSEPDAFLFILDILILALTGLLLLVSLTGFALAMYYFLKLSSEEKKQFNVYLRKNLNLE